MTACAAHSLAEVYAVMTALPVRPTIPLDQALLFLEQIHETVTIVALRENEYLKNIRAASEPGIAGGRIYDALLLAAARKVDPKTFIPGTSDISEKSHRTGEPDPCAA